MNMSQTVEKQEIEAKKAGAVAAMQTRWRTMRMAWRHLTAERPCAATAWLAFASAPLNGPHGR